MTGPETTGQTMDAGEAKEAAVVVGAVLVDGGDAALPPGRAPRHALLRHVLHLADGPAPVGGGEKS